ncbi:MAG: hypothetical protein ACR2GY_03920 [Phycisphaerales bacterium]
MPQNDTATAKLKGGLTSDRSSYGMGDDLNSLREQLESLRSDVSSLRVRLVQGTRDVAHSTSEFVRNHPRTSVGIAVGLGLATAAVALWLTRE